MSESGYDDISDMETGSGNSSGSSATHFLASLFQFLTFAAAVIGLVVGSIAYYRATYPPPCTCNTDTITAEVDALAVSVTTLGSSVTTLNSSVSNVSASAENVTTWPTISQTGGDFGWGASLAKNWSFTCITRGIGTSISSVTLEWRQVEENEDFLVALVAGSSNPWVINNGGIGVLPDTNDNRLAPQLAGFLPSTWIRCAIVGGDIVPVLITVSIDGDFALTLFNQTGGTTVLTAPSSVPAAWDGVSLNCKTVAQLSWLQFD